MLIIPVEIGCTHSYKHFSTIVLNGAGLVDLIMHKIIARHKNDTLVYWLKVLWIMSSPALLKQTLSVRVESAS